MKILFLVGGNVSGDLINWLIEDQKEDVFVWGGDSSLHLFDDIEPDLIISYGYRQIIKPNVIAKYKDKIINLHISYLPWNRGADPNVWSFLEDTPKGVTIHFIDNSIDTGDIIVQKELFFDEQKETFESTYKKLHIEIQKLFKNYWPIIKKGNIKHHPQNKYTGSYHYAALFTFFKIYFPLDKWDTNIREYKKRIEDKTREIR